MLESLSTVTFCRALLFALLKLIHAMFFRPFALGYLSRCKCYEFYELSSERQCNKKFITDEEKKAGY